MILKHKSLPANPFHPRLQSNLGNLFVLLFWLCGRNAVSKVGFISLGCPKNLVDSEVMVGLLQKGGHQITSDFSEAEVLVVNTCCFIEKSKKESIETILAAASYKTNGSCKRLIVAGCLPERYAAEIQSEMPEVDAILGVNQIERIVCAVEGHSSPLPDSYGRRKGEFYLYDHTQPRTLTGPGHTAYIKIAEGCDHACSFCIIPRIRGPLRSRKLDSLIREAEQLVEKGVKELTLVSQDTTSYGLDLGIKDGLATLLENLSEIDGLRWIRVLYTYPGGITSKLMDVIRDRKNICKYIDLPLQHASASILRAMKRGGDSRSLSKLIRRIREQIPGVTLRTTMIVGFPGETEEDFLELKEFCREMEFDRLGVFTYSDEEDTPAWLLRPKVPAQTAQKRLRALMGQQAAIARRKNRDLVGKDYPVLIEGRSEESEYLLQGRLESQAPEIDGVCLINDSEVGPVRDGEFRTIRITRVLGHDLMGKIVR